MPRDPRSRPGPRVAAKRELIVETPSERSPSRVPGRQGGGRRGRARHLEGLGLSALREQGRLVPRRAEPSRRSPRGSTRQTTSERKASGRCSSTGSNGRSTSCRRTGPVSGDAHGHLRDRPGAANGDQPVHGQRRSVRDARVRGVRDRHRRPAGRSRRGDGGVHAGLDGRWVPGRARQQGPRPGPAPPPSEPEQQRALRIEQFVDLLRRSLGAAP